MKTYVEIRLNQNPLAMAGLANPQPSTPVWKGELELPEDPNTALSQLFGYFNHSIALPRSLSVGDEVFIVNRIGQWNCCCENNGWSLI